MVCNKKHRKLSLFRTLPYSQANTANDRHVCCGCAYVLGLQDGLQGLPQQTVLPNSLPKSQAQAVRHRDAMTAYIWGYNEGLKLTS